MVASCPHKYHDAFFYEEEQLSGFDWSKIWNIAKPLLKTGLSFIPGVGPSLSAGVDIVEGLVTGTGQDAELQRLNVQARTSEAITRAQQKGIEVTEDLSMAEVIYQGIEQVLNQMGIPVPSKSIVDSVNAVLNIDSTKPTTKEDLTILSDISKDAESISQAFRTIPENAIVLSKRNLRTLNGLRNGTFRMTLFNDDNYKINPVRSSKTDILPSSNQDDLYDKETGQLITTPTTTTTNVIPLNKQTSEMKPVAYIPKRTELECRVIRGELPGSIRTELESLQTLKDKLAEGIYLLEKERDILREVKTLESQSYDKETGQLITTPTSTATTTPDFVNVYDWIVPETMEISKIEYKPIHVYSQPLGNPAYIRYDAPYQVFMDMVTRYGYTPVEINKFYPQGYDEDRWQIIPVSNTSFTNSFLPYLSNWET